MYNSLRKSSATAAFDKQLKRALKLYNKPAKLGEESPLATPYFLARAMPPDVGVITARDRGEILAKEIYRAADTLWHGALPRTREEVAVAILQIRQGAKDSRYAYLLLELRCFRKFIYVRRTADIWEDDRFFPGSRSDHYRDYDAAVHQLGLALLDRLQPTLRLESPPQPTHLIGYQTHLQHALDIVSDNQTVTISGAGGTGKTTLGAALVAAMPQKRAFWFTIRPQLNDSLSSILFCLSHFLHAAGASSLWQLLLADKESVNNFSVVMAMLRQDLAQLHSNRPLFCFDEVDRLDASASAHPVAAHAQIIEFLEELCQYAPVVMMCQRPVLPSALQLALDGLAVPQIDELLLQSQLVLSSAEVEQLYQHTGGNPRLLTLCTALLQRGESVTEMLTALPQTPAVQPILYRLWARLASADRRLVQQLAVFRSPTPEDAWHGQQGELTRLCQSRIVMHDGQGGIFLIPAIHDLVYAEITIELREQLHLHAAEIRLIRGEYAAATYHFWQGRDANKAVQIWYTHRNRAIERGQANAVRPIFEGISSRELSKPERNALALIRAELRQLTGDYQEGLAALEAFDWANGSESVVRAARLRGEFLEALGYPDQALQSFEEGSQIAARLLNQLTNLRYGRSMLHIRRREMSQAWREARFAEYEVLTLRGILEDEMGQYADAHISFQNALTLATSLEDDSAQARAERNLANIYGRLQKLDEAVAHATNAIHIFERLGDRLNVEYMRQNLSFIYLQTKQFQQAIEAATKAYCFFDEVGNSYFCAGAAANLAEAYFELGDLANAQQYAQAALARAERQIEPYALYTLGQVKQARGELAEATATFVESVLKARTNDEPYMEAYAQRALGKVCLEQGDTVRGRQALTDALQLFERLRIPDEISETQDALQASG